MTRSIMNCGTTGFGRRLFFLSLFAFSFAVLSPLANASILTFGACPAAMIPDTVQPCLANGMPAGTLLASISTPFTSSLGNPGGTLTSAVYREVGGTLDFYYQVTNSTMAGAATGTAGCGHGGGQNPCDDINRETNVDFSGWITQLAYRTDCATVVGMTPAPCPFFANGDTAPQTADRSGGIGDVIGFTFNGAPTPTPLHPGHTSNVLIISTNATNFKSGNSSVIDGGVTSVTTFEPSAAVPEPASLALVGLGLVTLAGLRRRVQTRR